MRKYAIIDFSASSLSLLIVKIEGSRMESVLHTRSQLSFSTSIYEGRILSDQEMFEIVETAEGMVSLCMQNKVEKVYAIASSTLSSMEDSSRLFALIKNKLGLTVQKMDIAQEGEARLITKEASLQSKTQLVVSSMSGLETLNTDNVSQVIPDQRESDAIKAEVRKALDEANLPEEGYFENAVLAGAYSWALYQLYAEYYKLSHQHGEKIIQYKKLKKLCKYLIRQENSRSLMILKSTPELMNLIVPATILAKELLKRFGVSNIIVSDLGVKEGVLKQIASGLREAEALELEG